MNALQRKRLMRQVHSSVRKFAIEAMDACEWKHGEEDEPFFLLDRWLTNCTDSFTPLAKLRLEYLKADPANAKRT
jgi:hypothetical protein